MLRWMSLALLCTALPAVADPARVLPAARAHGPMHDLAPADQKAIHDFKLTTSITDKLADAGKRVRELAEKNPALAKANPMEHSTSLDEGVKRIEQHPEVVREMKRAGVSPREFVVGSFTLMTSAVWSGMRKSYPQAQVPAYVNPDNLQFIDEHPEVLQKFQAAIGRERHQMQPQGAQTPQ